MLYGLITADAKAAWRVCKPESIPAGVGEAPGKDLGGAMGASAAASGGVLLNSAYLISELSMAGPLDAANGLPPIATPVCEQNFPYGKFEHYSRLLSRQMQGSSSQL